MNKESVCLLKFGKKDHIDQFSAGSLFCSDAVTLWGVEKDLKIRGQGDILEAGSRIFSNNFTMQQHGTSDTTEFNMKSNILVHYEPAEHIPVFCLYSVFPDECLMGTDGKLDIRLSDISKATICQHFPIADSFALITNPELFINDVKDSIGCRMEYGLVHYFNIDKGFDVNDGKQSAVDMEYFKYLTQDTPPISENGKKIYSFNADYVYRCLFCKDVFFSGEREYRIVLPNDYIKCGTHYPVRLSEKIKVYPIDLLFK